MGELFKSQTEVIQSPFENNPWKPQQDFIMTGLTGAKSALEGAMGVDAVAGLTEEQLASLRQMGALGLGTSQDVSSAAISAGMPGISNIGAAAGNARGIFDHVSGDRTNSVIANGGKFASNPYLDAQVNSVLGDVRKAFDRDVAGINGAAAGTGNMNSTRAGAMEAIAQDEAMDRAAAISSQMRGNAYESGMDRSMAMDANRTGNMMAANSQVGQMGALSSDIVNQGLSTGMSGAQTALNAGSVLQGQKQAELDALRNGDFDLLKQYMGIAGQNFGSSGFTSNVEKNPSIFQQLVGGVTSAYGAGMFG